jgi:putative transposase
MPRKKFSCDSTNPYHLTARTNSGARFELPMPVVWQIYSDQLFFLNRAFGAKIHSFVLMSNHFHLLATFPDANLSDAMCCFMGNTSRIISFEARSKNHLYGGRVFRSMLGSWHYFMNCYKYVYANPVRARLASRAEDYPYSTISGLLGQNHLSIPVEEDTILFGDEDNILNWINQTVEEKSLRAMRVGLKHATFKLPLELSSQRPNELETKLI